MAPTRPSERASPTIGCSPRPAQRWLKYGAVCCLTRSTIFSRCRMRSVSSATAQGTAQRQIAGGNPLGERDQVRSDPVVLGTEPLAETAEGGYDLVGHQQDAVFVADALDLRPVGFRRDDDAARSLDRLTDEGRYLVGTEFFDFLLQQAGLLQAEFLR
jgi:hypothetical protein